VIKLIIKYINYTYDLYVIKKLNKIILICNKLGIGDWGLGIGPNPQSPIPNPH